MSHAQTARNLLGAAVRRQHSPEKIARARRRMEAAKVLDAVDRLTELDDDDASEIVAAVAAKARQGK